VPRAGLGKKIAGRNRSWTETDRWRSLSFFLTIFAVGWTPFPVKTLTSGHGCPGTQKPLSDGMLAEVGFPRANTGPALDLGAGLFAGRTAAGQVFGLWRPQTEIGGALTKAVVRAVKRSRCRRRRSGGPGKSSYQGIWRTRCTAPLPGYRVRCIAFVTLVWLAGAGGPSTGPGRRGGSRVQHQAFGGLRPRRGIAAT